MDRQKWGRRIRSFRKLKGFTQVEFAKHIGYSVSIVGEVERGVRMPDRTFLSRVSTVLDISIAELTPDEYTTQLEGKGEDYV
ncbi:helix-turn-helix domain-containing protein [Salinibacillus xinjiangensis]|uniref:Helix-turn-helix domain-containing protein n=1 Tax=Salinibacillus xinjiangensis TaxID=1229268 RepID=A0A6G1XBE5_9BACI|nr:helix-turn-helix transcriptional regulator [Salinibacillus xinjiangensis]MRG88200.1 helix-turn-helix domain-containing protein [Salinibacillus xinjiangensis]